MTIHMRKPGEETTVVVTIIQISVTIPVSG